MDQDSYFCMLARQAYVSAVHEFLKLCEAVFKLFVYLNTDKISLNDDKLYWNNMTSFLATGSDIYNSSLMQTVQ